MKALFASAVLFSVLFSAAPAVASNSCQGVFKGSVTTADANAWSTERFSDPNHHDPNNFRYSVHMINLATGKRSAAEVYDSIVSDQSTREFLSYSVIQHDWVKTFGHVGFIIEVPPENILAANKDDMGTFNRDNIARWVELNGGIPTPDQLIAQGKADRGIYNEVLARPISRNGQRIRIVGVISTMPRGINTSLLDEVLLLANELQLPIVYTDKRDFSGR